jgi:hypothetical protein
MEGQKPASVGSRPKNEKKLTYALGPQIYRAPLAARPMRGECPWYMWMKWTKRTAAKKVGPRGKWLRVFWEGVFWHEKQAQRGLLQEHLH